MEILIDNATVVNEGRRFKGAVAIEDDRIKDIIRGEGTPRGRFDKVVDAAGCFVLPGVIDDHVHFREPGLTAKADIASETRAAVYGGVTSFFDMPNTVPQTTTLVALEAKYAIAARESRVNYSFFFGATNTNADLFGSLDVRRIPGIKLFMGSSTGNMLVDRQEALERVFASAPVLVMAHCEDTGLINANMARAKGMYGDDPDVVHHAEIRSAEACYCSTEHAVRLARRFGTRLHVAHVTTARELSLFEPWLDDMPQVTAEAVVAHLLFTEADHSRLGARIKCNPAVKSADDREALRRALTDGRIAVVGTDHAPHLLTDKQGGCCRAASGMPMLQFSLAAMLTLADEGVLSVERVVELMAHRPARLFGVRGRGFLRPGYKADIAVVRPGSRRTVTDGDVRSKCGWTPLVGRTLDWEVVHTFCNGRHVLNCGVIDDSVRGEEIEFER